jgi:membrane dipeptidase
MVSSKSELDPLLPQNEPAPEIQGEGFSKHTSYSGIQSYEDYKDPSSQWRTDPPEMSYQTQEVEHYDEEEEGAEEPSTSMQSALKRLIGFFSVVVFLAFLVSFLSPSMTDQRPIPYNPPRTISERVNAILEHTPLIDGHNDLAIFLRGAYGNKLHNATFRDTFENGGLELQVDLPRLRKGKVGGAFWSAFVVCPANASEDFSDPEYSGAVSHTLQQIDLLRRLQMEYPKEFTAATTPLSGQLEAFHAQKKLISPISIEGLHQLPQSAALSTLRLYYALGVRAATLTWNCHNAFADAALISNMDGTAVAPYHRGGLTEAGRKVVREMNRLGMLIDISHTSYWTQKAVLSNGTSVAPVIYSHSSAFALCPHPRNVHDDVLELVKQTGSLVMINFSPSFISCLPPATETVLPEFYAKNNTLHQVARHVVYVGEKIGYDHVGLGSDFDGMGTLTPEGLDGVDKYPDLIAELLKMGVNDSNAAKVAGGNLVRVWRKADEIAKRLQSQALEGEDDVTGW